jgi:hypothetical protein
LSTKLDNCDKSLPDLDALKDTNIESRRHINDCKYTLNAPDEENEIQPKIEKEGEA